MDYYKSGEPLQYLPGKTSNLSLDYYKANETLAALIPVIPSRIVHVLGDDSIWYNTGIYNVKIIGDDLVWYPIAQSHVHDGSSFVSLA